VVADSETKLSRGWIAKRDLADVFDVSTQHWDRHYSRFAAPEARKTVGGKLYYHGRQVLDAWAASLKGAAPAEGTDPLLSGAAPDSPGLERYREARADMAEMERDRLRLNLIPREELDPALAQFAGLLRRAGEALKRQFGNDAAALLNEAVDEAEAGWRTLLGVEAERESL
jgi:hypothetical protein